MKMNASMTRYQWSSELERVQRRQDKCWGDQEYNPNIAPSFNIEDFFSMLAYIGHFLNFIDLKTFDSSNS